MAAEGDARLGIDVRAMKPSRQVGGAKIVISAVVASEKENGVLVELQLF